MWTPVGLIYALAALALAARWISTSPLQKEIGVYRRGIDEHA
jgi:hypothetical protein